MLKYNEPNKLAVFGLRQLGHQPPHFAPVVFNISVGEKKITDWIYENLEGRFYIGPIDVKAGHGVARQHVAAFEIPSEASFFAMYLDQINQITW